MNIYYSYPYGKLYEEHENAKAEIFYFESQHGKMTHTFLKREIPYKINGTTYYDIFTPYGFGGPAVVEASNVDLLIKGYQKAFSNYCRNERIVSEFIRFHPIENEEVREQYDGDTENIGPSVIRDLSDPIKENMSKRILKQYRKNKREGMQIVFDETGEQVSEFLDIYYSTMDRNDATDYYYFEPEFFDLLHTELKGHFVYTYVYLNGEVISAGLNLYGDRYAYGFLGGTKEAYYESSPNINVEIEGMKWMQKKGIAHYLMGGGHKGEDGIYKFKKRFAKNSDYQYHIGKKIYDEFSYTTLVKEHFNTDPSTIHTSFFPAYRAKPHHLDKPIIAQAKR